MSIPPIRLAAIDIGTNSTKAQSTTSVCHSVSACPSEAIATEANDNASPNNSLTRLEVGDVPVYFTAHTSILRLSPCFDAMLNNNNNKTPGRLPLPAMHPNPVRFYIHFLYTGTIASDVACADNDAVGRITEVGLLCEFYEFGLVVKDPRFRNAVLDTIIDVSYLKDKDGKINIPSADFANKPHILQTQARRCIVDLYVHTLDPDDPAINGFGDQTFMCDVLKAALREWDSQDEQTSGRKASLRKCDYHEHPDGVRCDDGDQG